ncbi:zeta toxin family protein [Vibrio sp. SS-MA-C1-2]|uniref:zeta toxin family protein n=1 Tax=Vibrio sp. SS-MA-C1-2 TaxID=2908646 RepID=UPI001F233058|nr:zeta toxin family protein [Vibrio sp. SS-MA-C1-2]UJF17009.1 zeta toxin family protein [Vibrio sp. SS-MA-C1-2]
MSDKSDEQIEEEAITFAKKNRTAICRRLTDQSIYLPENEPVSVFMYGSPGDGKTRTYHANISSLKPYLDPPYIMEELQHIVK